MTTCTHKYVEFRKPKGGKGVLICETCKQELPLPLDALFKDEPA